MPGVLRVTGVICNTLVTPLISSGALRVDTPPERVVGFFADFDFDFDFDSIWSAGKPSVSRCSSSSSGNRVSGMRVCAFSSSIDMERISGTSEFSAREICLSPTSGAEHVF